MTVRSDAPITRAMTQEPTPAERYARGEIFDYHSQVWYRPLQLTTAEDAAMTDPEIQAMIERLP